MADAVSSLDVSGALRHAEHPPSRPALSPAKRACDIVVSLIALIFIAPLLLIAGLAVWVESGGPVLFRQRRTGLGGQPFVIYKLRTMYVQEDGHGLRHATRGDARVTRIGGFLRKSSIDELPQLINILKGDMSLVGPRPHAVGHDLHYAAQLPEYNDRFRTRPGLTGLAQVSGLRGEIHEIECMRRRVAADIDYVQQWSIGMDIQIVLRTVPMLFIDQRAY
jgi:putative colanic acid biosynthesis UDP-glucose lipid carrier transferase